MPELSSSEKLLHIYIKNDNLRKHCYAVESALRFYARKLGKGEDKWAAAGILHDLDWEMYPDTHPKLFQYQYLKKPVMTVRSLMQYWDMLIRTELMCRENLTWQNIYLPVMKLPDLLRHTLYMKPGGINEVDAKGIKKKMKDKAFAKNVAGMISSEVLLR